eukprot:CAMPEP_0197294160 /NCGR_PEP_ID=MMETSP0890-20130614/31280_1 /TAXON_ID=44058 ORGANISM="Aureoumbra lagunensis, Strain CCMP1510" /NCGR_SAMPLE_ID=MMETSP0890 /ASSEMBLY_ACC=CAM_ASM_000533 /LENGTH=78 /DNA_ID=CAMNT_0042769367 /DNA_START=459 /DNA_END=695 /DNA_ORIENTATION=-
MAAALLAKNKTLPEGLADQPYFDPTQRRPSSASSSVSFTGATVSEGGGFRGAGQRRQPLRIRAGVITPVTHHEEGWTA